MSKRIKTTAAVLLALLGFSARASIENLQPYPWLEEESRGYLMALCRMQEAGLIMPQQSTVFVTGYRDH